MKVFITGGTGFIGSHLIDSLLNQGNNEIYALVRDLNNLKWLKGLPLHFIRGDLHHIPTLSHDIDYVLHLAGFTKALKSADYYTVNREGTASLFQSLQRNRIHPKKVIYLSSLAAVGPCQQGRPIKETALPCPVTPYGKSKLLGEIEALKFKEEFTTVIIRVGPVFGPRDRDFLSYFKLIKMGILPGFGSLTRSVSLCYVKDLVKAFHLCMEKPIESGEIFHISDPIPYKWDEFGQKTSRVLGKKIKKIKLPLSAVNCIAWVSELGAKMKNKPSVLSRDKLKEMKQESWVADTQNAIDKLSFQPGYALEKALEETLNWYREHGWL